MRKGTRCHNIIHRHRCGAKQIG
uniref:Uncharacterized protein n=1 Tax=Anopheles dirus TaxID=7168 RepID=A0A182NYP7_9DIPT